METEGEMVWSHPCCVFISGRRDICETHQCWNKTCSNGEERNIPKHDIFKQHPHFLEKMKQRPITRFEPFFSSTSYIIIANDHHNPTLTPLIYLHGGFILNKPEEKVNLVPGLWLLAVFLSETETTMVAVYGSKIIIIIIMTNKNHKNKIEMVIYYHYYQIK